MTKLSNQSLNKGFLLTRNAHDSINGIVITLWLKTIVGIKKLIINDELAVLFIENSDSEQALMVLERKNIQLVKITPLSLKTFQQQNVTGFYFNSLKAFYNARNALKTNEIKCYEDDIRIEDRYLMERFITSGIEYRGNELNLQRYNEVVNAQCRTFHSTVELSMVSLDIECSMAGNLYSIGLYTDTTEQVFMIGDHIKEGSSNELNYIVWVTDEKQLLIQFIAWLNANDPDLIIGWNVINFDMHLLQQRCDHYNIVFSIGRDGSSPYWRTNKNNNQSYVSIAGRVVLDGIDLLKTATYSFPSFSLDHVSQSLLGLKKKVSDVDNRVKEINHNFLYDKPALAAYNLEDCRLVWLIFEKTKLLDFAKLRAQLTGLEIDRVGGSVAAFTNLYLPKLHRQGYIAPNMGDGKSDLVPPGGFVMDSIPGLYDNILVLDFKSLYPSIIKTFKIDPMGLIEGMQNKDSAIKGYDGAYFSRTKHFLPDIIAKLWQERDKAKKDDNAALSQAIKIIMNSFYGVLGSNGCRFFDPRLAGSITKRSHDILKSTKRWIENLGYQVIYGDTDSIFVHIGSDKNAEQSKQLGAELQDIINDKWTAEITENYQCESELEIEFETHFTKFVMPTIRGQDIGTKKRYAGMVVDVMPNNENKTEQKIIFKGLESVRTDWTELAKVFQYQLYTRVFNQQPVNDYIIDIVQKTRNGEFDDLLIYRKRIRRKLSDYVKNVPPHVKAARLADEKNKALGKSLKYQNRGWIEYFITINGPQVKEHIDSPLDYQFYIDRQLASVADGILPFIGTSFSDITDNQLNLFN